MRRDRHDGVLDDVVLVGHDWGVAIVLDRLRGHPSDVRGVALMESHLRPLCGWDAFDQGGRDLFQQLRTPGTGEQMVLEENFFLDTLLPAGLVRPLDTDELQVYRSPCPDRDSRRPLLRWAREVPVAGQPADVDHLMAAAAAHLATTTTPTLLLHGDPGVLVTADTLAWCRTHVPHLASVMSADRLGTSPEDRPGQVADALVGQVHHLP